MTLTGELIGGSVKEIPEMLQETMNFFLILFGCLRDTTITQPRTCGRCTDLLPCFCQIPEQVFQNGIEALFVVSLSSR